MQYIMKIVIICDFLNSKNHKSSLKVVYFEKKNAKNASVEMKNIIIM